jgi:uncharacterized delta-60 repeat protein
MKNTFRGGLAIGSLGLTLVLTAHAGPPVISYQPRAQNVALYERAAFGVIADGTPPFNYQWLKNRAPIAGATNDQIVIARAQFEDEGNYSVIVSNVDGNATSTNAALAVRLPHAGDLDGTFCTGSSIDGGVNSIAVQTNGKVVIAGDFTSVNGLVRGRVARLNIDGSADVTFMDGPVLADGTVNSVALQPDGKIVIGGEFTNVNGIARNHLARLNRDGSLDTNFLNGLSGIDTIFRYPYVYTVAVQNDGKILASGDFTGANGVTCSNIVRFNADGTLDGSFQGSLPRPVYAMLLQPDGKILVTGAVSNEVIRLNEDGTIDQSWNLSSLLSGVSHMALEEDGNVVVAGTCDCGYKGTPLPVVAKLFPDGTYQTNAFAVVPSFVGSVGVQADGKILVAGLMGPNSVVVRFNQNGSWDKVVVSNASIYSIARQNDGKMLIGGYISDRIGIARLNADDTLDDSFVTGIPTTDAYVGIAIVQPDGRLLIGGDFSTVHGVPRHSIARLNADGTLDATFGDALLTNDNAATEVNAISLQSGGKILVGGSFTKVGGATHGGIARLNADGTCDANFQTSVLQQNNYPGNVNVLVPQPDGRLLIGGNFKTVNGEGHTNIARLNADGTVDDSFQAQVGSDAFTAVSEMALQTDGKILIAGGLGTVDGEPRQYFARLNPDGSLDEDFAPNLPGGIPAIVLEPDGKIVVGTYRLNPDGSIDPSFTNSDQRGLMLLQDDGKIIEGGAESVARINPDGSLDNSFQSDEVAIPLATQPGNKILIGGDLRRLWGNDHPPVLRTPTVGATGVNLTWHAISNRTYRVQYTENLSTNDWHDLPGDVCATNDLTGKTDVTASTANQRYYRLQQLP